MHYSIQIDNGLSIGWTGPDIKVIKSYSRYLKVLKYSSLLRLKFQLGDRPLKATLMQI